MRAKQPLHPALPLFDPDTERPSSEAVELYLETAASVGVWYLGAIFDERSDIVEGVEAAWAAARQAAIDSLRENVYVKVGHDAQLPSGGSVGVFSQRSCI
jgi:hypothetical protein